MTPAPTPSFDELLPRLRARIADPARRTSVRPTAFGRQVASLDLGGMLSMLGDVSSALRGVVAANQAGRVDPAGAARARELEQAMTTPVDDPLPGPAAPEAIAAAEAALGVALPPALRRLYAEVADGGFGPGEGLLSLERVVAQWRELRTGGQMPVGREWPASLLPVVSMEPGWDCVDAATGEVVAWDPERLSERSSEAVFRRSFQRTFDSVEAWLADWLGAKTHAELRDEMMARLMSPEGQMRQAKQARDAVRRMTPEERAKAGLPAVGWEKVVFGGIGWDEANQREMVED